MLPLRFRTIVFDLDGTLVDSAPDIAAALNHALQHLGRRTLALDTVRGMIGHGVHALLRAALDETGGADEEALTRGLAVLTRYYSAHPCDLGRPYPGAGAALEALAAQGIALALCTNKLETLSRALLDALGWRDRVAAIVGGDTLAVTKPDPAPLRLAIDRAGGGPAIMIGDSIIDVQTARAAGVPCIAVSFGFADRPVAQLGADAVIDRFADLLPALTLL